MTELLELDPAITDPEKIVTQALARVMKECDSHLHIESGETGYRLRCRHGDELRLAGTLSKSSGERLVAAVRALARLSETLRGRSSGESIDTQWRYTRTNRIHMFTRY